MTTKVHPFGVLPEGNAFFSSTAPFAVRNSGLGLINKLTDEQFVDILIFLDGWSLATLSLVSKVTYVFSHCDFLWRDLVLYRTNGANIHFKKNWKLTFISLLVTEDKLPTIVPIRVPGLYSQYLFHNWLCANYEIERAAPGIFKHEDIPREDAMKLTILEFVLKYEIPNKPVIITNALKDWNALSAWSEDYLIEKCDDQLFRSTSAAAAMPATFTMKEYINYAKTTKEESPLYLFERGFTKIKALEKDYRVPKYFNYTDFENEGLTRRDHGKNHDFNNKLHNTDLFRALGDLRPDYRWMVIGSKQSGSIFHIDPNQTNAWNVCISGRKKWIFYPPGVHPPGVQSSADGADVVVPISTSEWLLNFWSFHQEARAHKDPSQRPFEAITHPGEVIFVPHGYWHMVINLDFSIALTHNYVSTSNLTDCLRFLKYKSDQISGIRDRLYDGGNSTSVPIEKLYEVFLDSLRKDGLFPKEELAVYIQEAFEKLEKKMYFNDIGSSMGSEHPNKRRKVTGTCNRIDDGTDSLTTSSDTESTDVGSSSTDAMSDCKKRKMNRSGTAGLFSSGNIANQSSEFSFSFNL